MTGVLIMAGGRSSRMRATAGAPHKALVPVLGMPMLERNLSWLLAGGFTDLHIAVAADEAPLLDAVRERAQPLVAAFGAQLTLLQETTPLGTLGACALCTAEGDLVVVNVDNLTGLDLHALLAEHRRRSAALSIASHVEVFLMPFGQLLLDAGDDGADRVTGLLEKPQAAYQISSGTYVLGVPAREAIEPGARSGPPELYQVLAARGLRTVAMRHAAPWIDVNDASALVRAETLVAAHQAEMERPWPAPDGQRIVLAAKDGTALCISHAGLQVGGRPGATAAEPAWPGARHIASFDEPLRCGQVLRCHLHLSEAGAGAAADGFEPLDRDPALRDSRIQDRCRAHLRLHAAQGGAP